MAMLDPAHAALVLIDLQNGITSLDLKPRTGSEIVARSLAFAANFRAAGGLVVPVHVGWHEDFGDAPRQSVDQPLSRGGVLPPDWMTFAPGLVQPGDVTITKRQWGAFTGTELDLQLRRRGRGTIILGGVATNFGVESTARHAWELGYQLIIAEDLCSSLDAAAHEFACTRIFPRIGQVRQSADIL